MPNDILINDLKKTIAEKKAIIFVGTGVSISATNNADVASWQGLLKHGAERCEQLNQNLPSGWKGRVLDGIKSSYMRELLAAAEQIEGELKDLGEYDRWLKETVGGLKALNKSTINAIKDLDLPIITTNYDNLLEEVTGLREITWKDERKIAPFFQGEELGIFHLHGHWDHPESVILGIKTYQNILNNDITQLFMRALQLGKSLLFIGFGAGLEDPNFKQFLEHGRTTLFSAQHRHFRLAKSDQVADTQSQHAGSKVYVLPYGAKYPDLVPFLQGLKPNPNPQLAH
ncbi:MAG: SIR2 family protein [Acidobacteria bacterium]|nr:SIR2 family protein [Acidobacteriota bacterium]